MIMFNLLFMDNGSILVCLGKKNSRLLVVIVVYKNNQKTCKHNYHHYQSSFDSKNEVPENKQA